MCNRVATPREDEIHGYFDKIDTNLSNTFRVDKYDHFHHITAFTMPQVPFVGLDDPLRISPAMWKFIPEKATLEAFKQYDTCNAKGEEVFEKRTYKDYIMKKRGLVVLKGFFEGQEQPDKTSQPYFIYPANGEILTLGCVYSDWTDASGNPVRTFSIITTEANKLMAQIHNKKKRMPLVVPPEKRLWWLDNALTKADLTEYFVPYPDGYLGAHKVSRNLYKRGHDNNTEAVQQAIS
jgi:putative SOS response-associated peptidase YedK